MIVENRSSRRCIKKGWYLSEYTVDEVSGRIQGGDKKKTKAYKSKLKKLKKYNHKMKLKRIRPDKWRNR